MKLTQGYLKNGFEETVCPYCESLNFAVTYTVNGKPCEYGKDLTRGLLCTTCNTFYMFTVCKPSSTTSCSPSSSDGVPSSNQSDTVLKTQLGQ